MPSAIRYVPGNSCLRVCWFSQTPEAVQMVKFISKHILTGLITILPVVLTFYLLYWFVVSAESVLGDMMRLWLPEGRYWPGMGLIAGL